MPAFAGTHPDDEEEKRSECLITGAGGSLGNDGWQELQTPAGPPGTSQHRPARDLKTATVPP